MSEVKIIGKRDAVMFSCEEGDGRRALCDLADAFSYREEPCAAKLRDPIETLDFIDLADSFEIVEDMDPLIIARAMTVLAALVANELDWGRKLHPLADSAEHRRNQGKRRGNMSEVKRMARLHALNFFRRHGDLRRALYELADAERFCEEPRAAKVRDAIETLAVTDPGDAWDVFEDTDPFVIAVAANVLLALVANELGWGRKAERLRN